MESPLRLLLIEDTPAEAELVAREFARYHIECDWRRVDSEPALIREIDNFRPQVIVSDFTLPGFDGLSALRIARARAPDIPFLFFSGTIGEATAIESLRRGAMDYVLKNNRARLVPAVERVRREMQTRVERRRTAQRLHDIIATAQDWIWELDAANQIMFTSPSILTILGRAPESTKNQDFAALALREDRAAVVSHLDELRAKSTPGRFVARFVHENRGTVWLETLALASIDAQGVITGIRGSSRDVTQMHRDSQDR